MYDTCRENDNLSSIITSRNFVNVTRFKDISHNEMFTLFCFSQNYSVIVPAIACYKEFSIWQVGTHILNDLGRQQSL